ncbi:MAG: SCO family protein [Bacteroidota bacterium]
MRKLLSLYISVFLLSCSQEKLPYYHTADFTPLWSGEQNFLVDTVHRVAPFEFKDQRRQIVNNETVDGKVYVANFFFTSCPSICPRMTNHLLKVQSAFAGREDFMLLSHTVMPWADTVERLNEFAVLNDIDHQIWRLVTGRQSEIYSMARQSYFAEEVAGFNRDSTNFVHTEHCILIDRDGHLRGIYNGTLELEIDRLIADIKILLD